MIPRILALIITFLTLSCNQNKRNNGSAPVYNTIKKKDVSSKKTTFNNDLNSELLRRYSLVVQNLNDIKNAQLMHKYETGHYQNDLDELMKFIESGIINITQKRDTTYLDDELTKKNGGAETFSKKVLIDTLGFVYVNDSLFHGDIRYRELMNIPVGNRASIELEIDTVLENGKEIEVFQAKAYKKDILSGLSLELINRELNNSFFGIKGDVLFIKSIIKKEEIVGEYFHWKPIIGTQQLTESNWSDIVEEESLKIKPMYEESMPTYAESTISNKNKTYSSDGSRCSICTQGVYVNGSCDLCGTVSAERLQETIDKLPKCSLCAGTGREKSRTSNESRTCPMCQGKGYRTY